MSWRNVLCTDTRCEKGCYHLGPQGQQCWYQTEQELCRILKLHWHQGLELNTLLTMIQDKLAGLPAEDDYDAQVKLATRFAAIHPAKLTAEPEDKDPA